MPNDRWRVAGANSLQWLADDEGRIIGFRDSRGMEYLIPSNAVDGALPADLLPALSAAQVQATQSLVSRDGLAWGNAISDFRRFRAGRSVLTPAGRLTDWTISNAANTTITEKIAVGSPLGLYALRFAHSPVASQAAFATKDVTFNLNTLAGMWVLLNVQFRQLNSLGLTIYTSDAAALAPGTGRFMASGFASTLTTGRTPVWVPKTKFTTLDGAPSWATDQKSLRIRIDSVNTTDRDVDFEGLFVGGGRPQVLLSFDDGWATSYSVGHLEARKRFIPLNHFLIPELIGTYGYVTDAQVQEMRANGDYLGLHGVSRWDQNPGQIAVGAAACRAKGIDTAHAAIPEGQIGDGYVWQSTKSAMQSAGILSARITGSVPPSIASPVLPGINDPYTLPAYPLNNAMTLAQGKAAVDDAVASGGTVIFYGHKLAGAADSLTWATSDYTALLDYIMQKRLEGALDTPRWDDWYAGR